YYTFNSFFFVLCVLVHLYLHSFPTRRSSDLCNLYKNRGIFIFELSLISWVIVVLCAIFIGFSKSGLPNSGILVVTVLMFIFPAKDRKSTRLNSSHVSISYAVFCLKKKKKHNR